MAKRVSEHLLEEIFKSERVSEYRGQVKDNKFFKLLYETIILVSQEPSRF